MAYPPLPPRIDQQRMLAGLGIFAINEYYHTVRPHLSLDRNAPIPRPIQGPNEDNVMTLPHVDGLHHGYRRAA